MLLRLPFLLCFCLSMSTLSAQGISFEAGASSTQTFPRRIGGIEIEQDVLLAAANHTFNFQVAATAQFHPNFALGLQVGTNNFIGRLIEQSGLRRIADVEGEQVFVEMLPEFRAGRQHWFFVNAGLGWQHAYTGKQRIFNISPGPDDLDSRRDLRANNLSYAVNVGGQLNVNRLGLRLGYGLRHWRFDPVGSTRITQILWQANLVYALSKQNKEHG